MLMSSFYVLRAPNAAGDVGEHKVAHGSSGANGFTYVHFGLVGSKGKRVQKAAHTTTPLSTHGGINMKAIGGYGSLRSLKKTNRGLYHGKNALAKPLHVHARGSGLGYGGVGGPSMLPVVCPNLARVSETWENTFVDDSIPLHPDVGSQDSIGSKHGDNLSFRDMLVGLSQEKKFKSATWDARPLKGNSVSNGLRISTNYSNTLMKKAHSSHVLEFLEKLKKEVDVGEQYFASNKLIGQFNHLWPKLLDLYD